MPNVKAETISKIAHQIFVATGAPGENAKTVGDHLMDANLAGHDSHGFIRIPQYVREIKEGQLDPKGKPSVAKETATTALVDGRRTFGQVVAKFATELAIEKARQSGVSFVAMSNLGHTGRVGTYPEMTAKVGMVGIMCMGNISGSWARVAPFGGREGRLGTNPVAISFPSGMGAPVLLDFATSMAAEGKVRVYKARGKELPDFWLLDKSGAPSRNPNDLYEGGVLLPVGGLSGGHKGYALSVISALLGGLLPALAVPSGDERRGGASIIVIDVQKLVPLEKLKAAVDEKLRTLKNTPPMQGTSGVLYPGEVEANMRKERLAKGVPIEDTTWNQVMAIVKEYGLEEKLKPLP